MWDTLSFTLFCIVYKIDWVNQCNKDNKLASKGSCFLKTPEPSLYLHIPVGGRLCN